MACCIRLSPRISSLRRIKMATAAQAPAPAAQGPSGIDGNGYRVAQSDIERFQRDGYVTLRSVMTEEELAREVDPIYEKFMRGEVPVTGGDLCDMSGGKDRTPGEYTVYNVMLPRRYYPQWQGNLYEQRCQAIANALCGGDMTLDYDQLLAKRPNSADAKFSWHQDMAYWRDFGTDNITTTCWLAVTDTTPRNGCLRFIPGSHASGTLRPHAPEGDPETGTHAVCTVVDETKEAFALAPLKRGDITVHNQLCVHDSGPNLTDGWRKGYVVAFRKSETVARERAIGFTHSHNDTVSVQYKQ